MNNLEKLEELKCYLEDQEIAIGDTYSLLRLYTIDGSIVGEQWLDSLREMMNETSNIISSLENYIGE